MKKLLISFTFYRWHQPTKSSVIQGYRISQDTAAIIWFPILGYGHVESRSRSVHWSALSQYVYWSPMDSIHNRGPFVLLCLLDKPINDYKTVSIALPSHRKDQFSIVSYHGPTCTTHGHTVCFGSGSSNKQKCIKKILLYTCNEIFHNYCLKVIQSFGKLWKLAG